MSPVRCLWERQSGSIVVYISSLPAEMNDGITLNGLFAGLVFGDDGWSRAAFLRALVVNSGGTVVTVLVNIVLSCWLKRNGIADVHP